MKAKEFVKKMKEIHEEAKTVLVKSQEEIKIEKKQLSTR